MDDILELFVTDYFLTGLRLGLIALVVGWALWFLWRGRAPRLPIVGIMIAIAVVTTIQLVEQALDPAIVPALILIMVGVGVAGALRAPAKVLPFAALPGAVVLALGSDVTELVWVRVMFAVLIPLGGYLINDFELRHDGLGLGVIYFALAVLGSFGAIPDTEWAIVLLPVATVVTFLAWPKVVGSLGPIGSFMAVTVFVWVTAMGGAARHASIVGGVACLGLLLLEPIIISRNPTAMRVSRSVRRDWLGAVVASVPQFMVVLICSRVAARFTSEWPALVIVSFVFVVVVWIGLVIPSDDTDSSRHLTAF